MARRRSILRDKGRRWTGLGRKRRWSVEEAQQLLGAQVESGQSLSAFAREYGLPLPRLYAWRRRLSPKAAAEGVAPRFLPVRVVSAGGPTSPELAGIEIVLGSGRRIRVSESTDPAVLARVIEVLERSTC